VNPTLTRLIIIIALIITITIIHEISYRAGQQK